MILKELRSKKQTNKQFLFSTFKTINSNNNKWIMFYLFDIQYSEGSKTGQKQEIKNDIVTYYYRSTFNLHDFIIFIKCSIQSKYHISIIFGARFHRKERFHRKIFIERKTANFVIFHKGRIELSKISFSLVAIFTIQKFPFTSYQFVLSPSIILVSYLVLDYRENFYSKENLKFCNFSQRQDRVKYNFIFTIYYLQVSFFQLLVRFQSKYHISIMFGVRFQRRFFGKENGKFCNFCKAGQS